MTGADVALVLGLFVLVLAAGGLWARGYDRRNARRWDR